MTKICSGKWMYRLVLATLFFVLAGCSSLQSAEDRDKTSARGELPKDAGASISESRLSSPAGQVSATGRQTPLQKSYMSAMRAKRRDAVSVPTASRGVSGFAGSTVKDAAEPVTADSYYLNPQKTGTNTSVNGDLVEFNFDNADIGEVIRSLAQILEIKYIEDPNIQGKVTIHTAEGIEKKNLFPVFMRILEVNGLTAVKEGALYRITPLKEAARLPIGLQFDSDGQAESATDKVITQVIPLRHASPAEMVKLLTPFLSPGGTIVAHDESKTLVVVDKGINVLKAMRLVEKFDINLFEKTNYSFFFLHNSEAEDVVKVLQEAFPSPQPGNQDYIKFIPIRRLNAFLVLSHNRAVLDRIDKLLVSLDTESMSVEPRIYVYFVKNGAAANLASLLNQVFSKQSEKPAQTITETATAMPEPLYQLPGQPVESQVQAETPVPSGITIESNPLSVNRPSSSAQESVKTTIDLMSSGQSSTLKGEVRITADEIRNALIIGATPADYRIIENILNSIDILPRQVLIEATIAEIGLDESKDLGVDWTYARDANYINGLQTLTLNGATGLTAAVGIGDEVLARFHALAQQNKVNILSSPHVLASDNREARIDVSNEIPIASSQTIITSGEPIVTTNVQYRDTGVMLSVIPHINERGLVTLDISQEVSERSEDVQVAGVDYPSFFKRTVNTSLTVKHGQTIVLGGLIRENKSNRSSGLPVLSRIPIIGALFGRQDDSASKTELIILLSPRVIINLEDVDSVTNAFTRKVKDIEMLSF